MKSKMKKTTSSVKMIYTKNRQSVKHKQGCYWAYMKSEHFQTILDCVMRYTRPAAYKGNKQCPKT